MSFFVAGFILAGSGWSLVIAGTMQHKPDWSVCGQDMCSCLPTTSLEPYCELCVTSESESDSCTDSQSTPTDSPKRMPQSSRFEIASSASQAGCASIFLSFAFGTPVDTKSLRRASSVHLTNNDEAPSDLSIDPSTPPPRI